MSLKEEIDLIAAMYSNPKEFHIDKNSSETGSNLSFSMSLTVADDCKIVFSCHLHEGYPLTIPTVYVLCPNLIKSMNSKLQSDLHNFLRINEWIGKPMLCSLIDWLKDNICHYSNVESTTDEFADNGISPEVQKSTYVLQLDHMRSKSRYIKHLQAFAKELSIYGYVIFVHQLIFIILQGFDSSIKEFIIKLRVQKVDIDSSGHPCKERMLKVLGKVESNLLFHYENNKNLDVKELNDVCELEQLLAEVKLCDLCEKFILPVMNCA